MTILLVDDEPRLRATIARSLTIRGHVVDEVSTYEAAVHAALTRFYDLLLLDVNLPDGTGWDVMRDLQAASRSVPTVVFSAVRPSRQRISEFAPVGVLNKPFPIDALISLVQRVDADRRLSGEPTADLNGGD